MLTRSVYMARTLMTFQNAHIGHTHSVQLDLVIHSTHIHQPPSPTLIFHFIREQQKKSAHPNFRRTKETFHLYCDIGCGYSDFMGPISRLCVCAAFAKK